jgi:hypothetical protein
LSLPKRELVFYTKICTLLWLFYGSGIDFNKKTGLYTQI